jgi:hypothetical protein
MRARRAEFNMGARMGCGMFGSKHSALVRALTRSGAAVSPAEPPVTIPPMLPPAPPGMTRFSDLLREIMFAAFGENFLVTVQKAYERAHRLQAALDRHEAKQRDRAAQTPAERIDGLLALGQFALDVQTPEGMLSRANVERVREHLRRLDETAIERREAFNLAISHAYQFLRTLGIQGALTGAVTVDAAGTHRPIKATAWGHKRNWERLLRERMFEAGDEALSEPGMPCVPVATADALAAFARERGVAALGDIPGALRTLGARPLEPPRKWKSAVEWFLSEGQAEIRADLTARKALTEGAVCREAARRWNEMAPDLKSDKAKPIVREGAFKKANTRIPKGATGGTV